jgi:hypothetical protein
MKFLIQKIEGEIKHDFSFTLLESIRYQNWLHDDKNYIKYKTIEYLGDYSFKSYMKEYIPIGSVEFVTAFLEYFYEKTPKPINVPEELFHSTYRNIMNGTEKDIKSLKGRWFIKSNDKIKEFSEIIDINENTIIPPGNYQISQYVDIQSEWRSFIYKGKLVGLHNYSGDFTKFPSVDTIKGMILKYKDAPIAYTLDVGVTDFSTFVIECHDFFSCGLYGFSDHTILPNMFHKWYLNYIK